MKFADIERAAKLKERVVQLDSHITFLNEYYGSVQVGVGRLATDGRDLRDWPKCPSEPLALAHKDWKSFLELQRSAAVMELTQLGVDIG